MTAPRSTPTSVAALAVAGASLLVATGSTAWAAGLAPGSVGTKQLRADAVTGAKVRDGSLGVDDLRRTVWTTSPGPRPTSWSTQTFTLPDAPRGTYLASYTIAVDSDADQPPGAQLYCDARTGLGGPYRAKTTAPFVPRTAFASASWTFTGDPADWTIACALYLAPDDGPVVEFPAPMNLTDTFPSEITLLAVSG